MINDSQENSIMNNLLNTHTHTHIYIYIYNAIGKSGSNSRRGNVLSLIANAIMKDIHRSLLFSVKNK